MSDDKQPSLSQEAREVASAATALGGKAAAAAAKATGRLGVRLGKAFFRSSAETKGATVGTALVGGTGLAIGPHVGIAALGSAVSGAVVLPVAGAVVGAVVGYAAIKMVRDFAHRENNKNTKFQDPEVP